MEGSYVLEATVLDRGRVGLDACRPNVEDVDCAVVRARSARVLTAGEAERIRQAFGALRIHRGFGDHCFGPDDRCLLEPTEQW
jgi:hypothetical protein